MKLCLRALSASLAIISTDVSAAAMDPGHDAPAPGSAHGVTPALAEISREQHQIATKLMYLEIEIGNDIIAFCDNFVHVQASFIFLAPLLLSRDAAVRDAACAASRIVAIQGLERLHEYFKIILKAIKKFNERKKREMTVFGSSELYADALRIVAEQCSCGTEYRAEEILSFLLLARRMAEAFPQPPSPEEIAETQEWLNADASHAAKRIDGKPREITDEERARQDALARMIRYSNLTHKIDALGTRPSEAWCHDLLEILQSLRP